MKNILGHRFSYPLPLSDHTPSGKQLFTCVREGCNYSNPAPSRYDFCAGVCDHALHTPPFEASVIDPEASTEEVRKRFPRFMGECSECGGYVILYASLEHYIRGDW